VGNQIALGASLLALGLAAVVPATAQPIYSAPPPGYQPIPGLAPSHVLAVVRAAGLRPLTQPARRGPRYVILAADAYGQQLRVVVDAHGGRILRIAPAHDPRFAGPPLRPPGVVPLPRHAGLPPAPPPRPPELKDPAVTGSIGGPLVAPPGSPANPRVAGVPPQAGSGAGQAARQAPALPASPPLPRPRPTLAATTAEPPPAAPPPPPAAAPAAPAAETVPAKPQPIAPAEEPAKPSDTKLVPVAPLE
jgi:hypothetical protein